MPTCGEVDRVEWYDHYNWICPTSRVMQNLQMVDGTLVKEQN